jgi:hypothetical protein
MLLLLRHRGETPVGESPGGWGAPSDGSGHLQPDDGEHCSSAVGLLAAVVALVFVQCWILNYGIFTLFL